jgi:FkbM family methyltransferase
MKLNELLQTERLTEIVDVGSNPIDGEPPYASLLKEGLCKVTGFEPQETAYKKLLATQQHNETHLPYALGDGKQHVLNLCRASGMSSLLEPNPEVLDLFDHLKFIAQVIEKVTVQTKRLDEIEEIKNLDFLKIDCQGSELMIFKNGKEKLSQAVVIQTEVSFLTLYRNQPTHAEIDLELRSQGFIPHCFMAIKRWPISPCVVESNPKRPLNQLLEADLVYVRDFSKQESMSGEQLKHLALIAHHCYGSVDLTLHCIKRLEASGGIRRGTLKSYLEQVKETVPLKPY